MTQQPDHDTPDEEFVDELASRLLDHDITLEEIDVRLRPLVVARRDVFATNRERLRRETPVGAAPVERRRTLRYTVTGLAAAAVVGIVGVAISASDDDTDQTMVADTPAVADAPAVTDAEISGAVPELETDGGLGSEVLDQKSVIAAAPMAAMTASTCPDPLGRPLLFSGVYDGEPVEVYFGPDLGLVVYRLNDCSEVLGIVP